MGLDIFRPQDLETESIQAENLPCWMLDTDYNGMVFMARQVFSPKTSAWDTLQNLSQGRLARQPVIGVGCAGIDGASFLNCTVSPYINRRMAMNTTTVNKFRDGLKRYVDEVATDHRPLRVTRRSGADFVVVSAEDWERDQETLYVLQNSSLMRQIAASSATHQAGAGYRPTPGQLDEILGD